MPKVWKLTETGIKRIPTNGDWYDWHGIPVKCRGEDLCNEYPILSLEIYDSDPMEGIREFIKDYEEAFHLGYIDTGDFYNRLQPIKKAMEGK